MNLTALALLTLATSSGQSPAELLPTKSRTLKLDIDYKPDQRKNIAQVQLVVSDNQGQSYQVWDAVTPDKDHLVFTAKDDGVYWVNMVIRFRDGSQDPVDPSRVPPAMKLMVDATAPVVRIASAQRVGDEVVVEWTLDEKFPKETATTVKFKPTGPNAFGDWQAIPATGLGKNVAKFNPGTAGSVAVQVSATDLAGNTATATRDVSSGVTTSYLSANPSAQPEVTPTGAGVSAAGVTAPSSPIPPPNIPRSESPTAPPTPPAGTNWSPPAAPAAGGTPLPVSSESNVPKPIPVMSGPPAAPAFTPSSTELPGVTYVRTPRFDLQYQVENGPSGVSRIDLYVTRDDGRTWTKWSQHDGRESPLKVKLDTPFNSQREGDYGFKLVPVSGVGLTDDAPSPGTAPELRVHLDETPPLIRPFQPTADSTQRNTLVLHWQASDRNLGREPIAIEWSESPTGPWKPVAGGDAVLPVGDGIATAPNRLPNTGSFAWQLPASMTTHKVYLKFTAWDAAGNKSEVVTQSPVLVDLTKPRARIQGIAPGTTVPRQ